MIVIFLLPHFNGYLKNKGIYLAKGMAKMEFSKVLILVRGIKY
jgi:hypothetical protein